LVTHEKSCRIRERRRRQVDEAPGLFSAPEGWPEDSPIWSSSLNSYRVLWPCHRQLTPKYRQLVAGMAATERVHHLRSRREIRIFLGDIEREYTATK
jgi:hypothetical protein